MKQTITLLCRFWKQRILMKCCQKSSDCECFSCDSISLFLLSLERDSHHVHPPSLRLGSSKKGRSSSTWGTFSFNCQPRISVEKKLPPRKRNTQSAKSSLSIARGMARHDSKVSKLAQSVLGYKRRDFPRTRISSQRPSSYYSGID